MLLLVSVVTLLVVGGCWLWVVGCAELLIVVMIVVVAVVSLLCLFFFLFSLSVVSVAVVADAL